MSDLPWGEAMVLMEHFVRLVYCGSGKKEGLMELQPRRPCVTLFLDLNLLENEV